MSRDDRRRWPLWWLRLALLSASIGASWIEPTILRAVAFVGLVSIAISYGEARAEKMERLRQRIRAPAAADGEAGHAG